MESDRLRKKKNIIKKEFSSWFFVLQPFHCSDFSQNQREENDITKQSNNNQRKNSF